MAAAAPGPTFETKNGLVTAHDADGNIMGYGDPVDRTYLVPNASEAALAAATAFGVKRFVFQADTEIPGLISFSRDRVVPTAAFTSPAIPEGYIVKTGAEAMTTLHALYDDEKTMYTCLLTDFFAQAEFTSGKQTEYQNGDIEGDWCRLNNEHITPIALFDATGKLTAIARVFITPGHGDQTGCAYFSDEMVTADIAKDSEAHSTLLAALIHTAASLAAKAGIKQMLLRAADGREAQYDAAGATTDGVPGVIHGGPGDEYASLHKAALAAGREALGLGADVSKTALSGFHKATTPSDTPGSEPTL